MPAYEVEEHDGKITVNFQNNMYAAIAKSALLAAGVEPEKLGYTPERLGFVPGGEAKYVEGQLERIDTAANLVTQEKQLTLEGISKQVFDELMIQAMGTSNAVRDFALNISDEKRAVFFIPHFNAESGRVVPALMLTKTDPLDQSKLRDTLDRAFVKAGLIDMTADTASIRHHDSSLPVSSNSYIELTAVTPGTDKLFALESAVQALAAEQVPEKRMTLHPPSGPMSPAERLRRKALAEQEAGEGFTIREENKPNPGRAV